MSMNMIPLSTLEAVKIPRSKIMGFPMEVTGFRGRGENTVGYIQSWLKVGPIAALTHFHMVKIEVSYHVFSEGHGYTSTASSLQHTTNCHGMTYW